VKSVNGRPKEGRNGSPRPLGTGPRIFLYSHDTYGLGHFRRNLLLADALARAIPDVSILCATGSPHSHSFRLPPRFDYLKIPSTTKNPDGTYRSRTLDLTLEEVTELRSRILRVGALSFRPDLVLVDQTPTGMEEELLPALRELRREWPQTRLVFGMRDLIDDPSRVVADWSRPGPREALETLYDAIFVYGMRRVFDVPKEYRFEPALAAKVRILGYLDPGAPAEPRGKTRAALGLANGRPLVLVTVGGGGDGDLVVRTFLRALRDEGDPGFDSLVVTGPLMSSRKRAKFRDIASRLHGVRLVEFIPNLLDYVAAADAVVGMAGYNSVCEILSVGAPSLLVPRNRPRLEQTVRARRLARLGLATVLEPDLLTPQGLLDSIRALLRGDRPKPRLALDFGGTVRAVRAIRGLLEGGARARVRLARALRP
jgi:predicted glycosyltransferase